MSEPVSNPRFDGIEIPDIPWVNVVLQDGPLLGRGVNGAQIDDVLVWTIRVLRQMNSSHPSRQTSLAITKIEESIHWLEDRTAERTRRGVEGTNQE